MMRKPRLIARWLMGAACFTLAGMFFPLALPNLFAPIKEHSDIYLMICMILFFVLAGASIVISLLYWRCPRCQKRFPLRYGAMDKAESCPFCGEKIK